MAAPGRSNMAVIHNGFKAALAAAPALIDGSEGDDARRTRVADFLASTLTLVEHHHHLEEEVLFPLFLEQVPEERATIALGIEEHHDMLSLLGAAKTSVAEWSTRGDAEASWAVYALAAFNDAFSAHMVHEESTIVPLLEQHLTEETWTMLEEQLKAALPELAELLLPVAFGLSLLWEALGEASFRGMVVRPTRQPTPA